MSDPTPLSSDDLRAYAWQDLIDSSSFGRTTSYFNLLLSEADKYNKTGNLIGERVYRLLTFVACCRPRYDNPKEPFAPKDGTGGASPYALSSEELRVLSEIRDEIRDPDFRSRVADILWECQHPRSPKNAEVAVLAYLEYSRALESERLWHPFFDRITRAWSLASKLGRDKALFLGVADHVNDSLARYQDKPETELLCLSLLGLLLELGRDEARYARTSEGFALSLQQLAKWDFANRYWKIASEFYRRAGDQVNQERTQLCAAECWPKLAENILAEGKLGAGAAAHWMSAGVHALRNAKADSAFVQKMHLRLIELQKMAIAEIRPLTIHGDQIPGITDAYKRCSEAAARRVSKQTFHDAIFLFATLRSPVEADEVRKQVDQQTTRHPELGLFPAVAVAASGRYEDHSPSMHASDPSQREEAIQNAMFIQCRMIYWDIEVKWAIDPARQQILDEHSGTVSDLAFLVVDNPLIPPGHEEIYLRGIHAGLHGDMLTAMHLLIPQLEASIRMIFQQRGIATSTLESDSTQSERDLGWLLSHSEMTKVFGDAAFSFRGILINRFGYNLRNNMAHGLISEEGFYTTGSVYLWWLIVRLLCQGYRLMRSEVALGAEA